MPRIINAYYESKKKKRKSEDWWKSPEGQKWQNRIHIKKLKKFKEDTQKTYWLYSYNTPQAKTIQVEQTDALSKIT